MAAFILIGSRVGDLIGRKRAYVIGLVGYAIGALAMALAQSLLAVIVFWAVIGGLGASLMLPAMQSLIHSNFEGAAQKKAYAMGAGAAAAIAAAVGPLLGGALTTYLSWRVGFLLEDLVIIVVLSQIKLVLTRPTTARGRSTSWGRFCRCSGWVEWSSESSSGRKGGRVCCRPDRRGIGRPRGARLLAGTAQTRRKDDADRPWSIHIASVSVRDHRRDAGSRSHSVG